jgi:hypothetical protein
MNLGEQLREAQVNSEKILAEKLADLNSEFKGQVRQYLPELMEEVKKKLITMAKAGMNRIDISMLHLGDDSFGDINFSGNQKLKTYECFGRLDHISVPIPKSLKDTIRRLMSTVGDNNVLAKASVQARTGNCILELISEKLEAEGVKIRKNNSLEYYSMALTIEI